MAAAPAYDRIVNLGDVVGYNASPNEVCERVIAMGAPIVRGNHDRACAGLTDVREFNPVAAISAYWTRNILRPEHLEWLRELPQGPLRSNDFSGIEFVHGSPLDEDEYLLNTATADDNLELPGHAPLIFFGHTHIQGGFVDEDGESRPFRPMYDSDEGSGEYHHVAYSRRALSHQPRLGRAASRQRLALGLRPVRKQWRTAGQRYVLPHTLRHRTSPAAHSVCAIAGAFGRTPQARALAIG